jgi:hypothetical protein
MTKFEPIGKELELEMLKGDDVDFSRTKRHLLPLIVSALKTEGLSSDKLGNFPELILGDVPTAAKSHLEADGQKRSYPFSVYFTWYIKQRLDQREKNEKSPA